MSLRGGEPEVIARDLEDGGHPGPVVRGSRTSRHRVVVGDEHDVAGGVLSLDPRVDVVQTRYRRSPLLRSSRCCLLDGGAQPERRKPVDQIVTDLGVGRGAHRVRPLADLLDVGEGPLRREFVRRSARG